MTAVIGLLLVLLGLAVGFILAWAFRVGATANLFLGVLLVVAGAIVAFVSEWLIDEAYRKNRELQRQLSQRSNLALEPAAARDGPNGGTSSESLAELMRHHAQEEQDIRQQLATANAELDAVHGELGAYQRTHPDDLTVIKGIGSVYQWKLRDCGFSTYQQLAVADPAQLRRMLGIKNWQRADVESWIGQARDWAQRG